MIVSLVWIAPPIVNPSTGGTNGVAPVLMKIRSALKIFSPSAVSTATVWSSTKRAVPSIICVFSTESTLL